MEVGLSPSFWAEAINTANYIRNRCETLCEIWIGKNPKSNTSDNLAVEWCVLADVIEKIENKCKEHRIWITEEMRLIISFNEETRQI